MFRRKRKQSDFTAEIEVHIELEIDCLKEQGMTEEEARSAARRAFGNVTRAEERFYESHRWLWWDHLLQDVRFSLRMLLAGSSGFTAVALISLGLGICIATCALSEMNGMVLRHLPGVAKPSELVALETPTSYPAYKRYRDLTDLFSSTAAYVAPVPFALSLDGRTERTWGHLVTPSYFSTFEVQPALGRLFDQQEKYPGQSATVIVSYRFWQEHMGSDRAVIGNTLHINGQPATVIGVGPKDFLGASPFLFHADLWMPISVGGGVAPELADNALERRDLTTFRVVGRLKPGISINSAEAEMDTVAHQLDEDNGKANLERQDRLVRLVPGGKLLPLRKEDVPFFSSFLLVMTALIMLIACSNVANMMLARAAGRRREIAVRLALGASRWCIARQLLTESMIVATCAGLLGFLLSQWAMSLLSQVRMPFPMPVTYDYRPDGRVLLFTMALTVLGGLALGCVPALQATRTDITPALKEGGNVVLRRLRRLSLRNVLMVSQVAGGLTLLVMLGLMSLGIQSTLGIQAGFNPKNLYLISLDPIRDGYPSQRTTAFLQKLLDRVKTLSAVTSACLTETVPVTLDTGGVIFSMPAADGRSRVTGNAVKYVVGGDYFDTTAVPILLGRGFRKEDEANDANPVIVTQEFVRRFWKGQDPVGRSLEIGNDDEPAPPGIFPGSFENRPALAGKARRVYRVVGVAGDVANDLLVQNEHPAIYFPLRSPDYAQPSVEGVTLVVRVAPGTDALGAVRREISTIDERVIPFNPRSMRQQIEQFMSPLRLAAWTYGFIGVFGLILASVGLAGVTAYSVTQRGHEIGIRMALGARSKHVLGLVMKEGIVLVTVGTIIGMAGAWAGSQFLSAMNSSVGTVTSTSATNPLVLVGAPLLLAAVALTACFVPARKSVRIDPAGALRQE
jgi:macrolide transport system ATP-binding/permease protein